MADCPLVGLDSISDRGQKFSHGYQLQTGVAALGPLQSVRLVPEAFSSGQRTGD